MSELRNIITRPRIKFEIIYLPFVILSYIISYIAITNYLTYEQNNKAFKTKNQIPIYLHVLSVNIEKIAS